VPPPTAVPVSAYIPVGEGEEKAITFFWANQENDEEESYGDDGGIGEVASEVPGWNFFEFPGWAAQPPLLYVSNVIHDIDDFEMAELLFFTKQH